MRSKSSKSRVFPDQSCSAGVAMWSAALVRDRFVAARGGCVDTPAPLVGRGLPRAKGAFAKGEPSSNSPVKFGKKSFSWCLASTMRQPDLLVFAPSLAKGMSETRKGMRTDRLLAEGVQPLVPVRRGCNCSQAYPGTSRKPLAQKIATLARVANRLRKKLRSTEGVQPFAGRGGATACLSGGGATLHSSNSLTFFSNALTFFCVQGVEVDSLREEEGRPWTGGGRGENSGQIGCPRCRGGFS